MRIFRHHTELPEDARGAVVAIGNFDGVHLGHREVIEAATRTFAGIITQQASGGAMIDVQPILEVEANDEPHVNGTNNEDGPGENGSKSPGP